jgi:hypothetical protein
MSVTVTFNNDQMRKLQQLAATRENQTVEQIANTVVERGLYDLCYRSKRNREQWQMFREYKKSLQK